MPVPQPPTELRQNRSAFGAGTVIVGLVSLFLLSAYWLFDHAGRSAALVAHTLDVKRATNELMTLTLDAETGQRGYLLTGDKSFLEPYISASQIIDEKLQALIVLSKDNALQSEILKKVEGLIETRMAGLRRSIQRIDEGDRDTAISNLRQGRGKDVQDNLRAALRSVLDEEHRLLAVRQADVEKNRLLALMPLFFALVGLAWLGWRETQRHRSEYGLLKQYNQKLDVLVRKRTEELERERSRVEALLRDVTHRVGNNLAMIAALLNIQRRRIDDKRVQQALEEVATRIQAMAAGQRRMNLDIQTDEVDGKPYIENLLDDLRSSIGDKKISIKSDLANLRLPGKDAVSYIILVNELVTNAMKHAFTPGMDGQIKVTMRKMDDADGEFVVITVEDDGIGNAGGDGKGLGKTVLRSLLQSLDGELIREELNPGADRPGYRAIMRMPQRLSVTEPAAEPALATAH
ncbi:MAG: sensor histidine kinase [Beijerinckiaceae bacterium]